MVSRQDVLKMGSEQLVLNHRERRTLRINLDEDIDIVKRSQVLFEVHIVGDPIVFGIHPDSQGMADINWIHW